MVRICSVLPFLYRTFLKIILIISFVQRRSKYTDDIIDICHIIKKVTGRDGTNYNRNVMMIPYSN